MDQRARFAAAEHQSAMHTGVVVRTLGVLLLLFSATLLPPIAISWAYRDGESAHLLATFLLALAAGLALWLPFKQRSYAIRNRDGFLVVALMWMAMSLLGAVPFILSVDMTLADAVFEATSGYTTTGATVITGLDELPRSILFYRQEINWIGGIGVIVLAVALLPMLRVGGMQLYRAETPGPIKNEKITPRIAGTARTLCLLYGWLTAACACLYWVAGMSPFDAVTHSFATLATGGFSTHDASFAYFDSRLIELIGIVFMLIGGISFSVHFLVWRTLRPWPYFRSTEIRVFLAVVVSLIYGMAIVLYFTQAKASIDEAFRSASFQVVSVITSTGFTTDDFSSWPLALPIIMILASMMGGCAGSTSGGIKVLRFVLLSKQGAAHIHRLIHPRAMLPIKVDGRVVSASVIEGVWGFFAIYVAVYALAMVVLMMDGMDHITAFGAVAACLNNLGPGLGSVSSNFGSVETGSKLVLSLVMLLGRLEILTILVLLTPAFWRR